MSTKKTSHPNHRAAVAEALLGQGGPARGLLVALGLDQTLLELLMVGTSPKLAKLDDGWPESVEEQGSSLVSMETPY